MHGRWAKPRDAASDAGGLMPDLAIMREGLADRDRLAGDGAGIGFVLNKKTARDRVSPAPVRKYSGMIVSSVFGLLLLWGHVT